MTKRIKKLTKEQEALIPVYAKKWIEIGLKTGDADFATFDRFMPVCYAKAGLAYPNNVVRVQSPLVGGLAAAIAEQIWRKKRDAVDGAVDGAVEVAVHGAVDGAVEICKKLGIKIEWHHWLGGQFWVGGWYWGNAYVDFFINACGMKLAKDMEERAHAYSMVNQSVNYVWPNRNFVIVCDRPKSICRDEDGRLHNVKGKSIEYKDGWGLYHVHGVKFTEEQHRQAMKSAAPEILNWPDIEQRVALMRERPVTELLVECDAKIISHSDECGGYDLHEIELKGMGKAKVLSFKAWSCGKRYAHFVPSSETDALTAAANQRGLTVDEFRKAKKS